MQPDLHTLLATPHFDGKSTNQSAAFTNPIFNRTRTVTYHKRFFRRPVAIQLHRGVQVARGAYVNLIMRNRATTQTYRHACKRVSFGGETLGKPHPSADRLRTDSRRPQRCFSKTPVFLLVKESGSQWGLFLQLS